MRENDISSSAYEEVVERLLKLAVQRDGHNDVQTHRLRRYRGKSGHEHEIDVSFELTVAGLRFLIVAECKRYKRRVGIDDVMEFAYRIRDIGAHKGVLVTTSGFQDGAIDVAKSEGIGLLIAARGTLHYYMGSHYQEYKYWFGAMTFRHDPDRNQVFLLGRRFVAGNAHATIVGIENPRGGEPVFVLPTECHPETFADERDRDYKGCLVAIRRRSDTAAVSDDEEVIA